MGSSSVPKRAVCFRFASRVPSKPLTGLLDYAWQPHPNSRHDRSRFAGTDAPGGRQGKSIPKAGTLANLLPGPDNILETGFFGPVSSVQVRMQVLHQLLVLLANGFH